MNHDSKRIRLLSAVLLLIVFLAGSLTGAAALDRAPETRVSQRISVGSGPGLAALDLSAGQQASVDAIVAQHQPAADAIIQSAMQELLTIVEQMDAEVRAVLSPDQIERLDSLTSQGTRIRAVRRTLGPEGEVLDADTIR